jgi:hypothetical protein
MPEKVAIVGSRGYPDQRAVREYVKALPHETVIVSGGCPNSPDEWAESVARGRGMRVWSYPVDTVGLPEGGDERRRAFGRRAYERNAKIVAAADRVVAFYDGQSHGTRNTIALARKHGKPVEVIELPERLRPVPLAALR